MKQELGGPLSAIVLAAGFGTRMKSRKSKVLHEAGGMALVEHVLAAAEASLGAYSGADREAGRLTVVVGHQAEDVKTRLAGRGCQFVLQAEQKGTGHAVAMCEPVAAKEGLTVILYGDCPLLTADTIARLVASQKASSAAATVITTMLADPTGYGRILRDADGGVVAIVEQKAATAEQQLIPEINSGIYCVDSTWLWKAVGEITPSPASGELYLTDLVEILRRHGQRVEALVLEDPNEILGINTRLELADADRILRTRKARQLMRDGVTILQPETVTIDGAVQIGMDTVVEAFSQIRGRTVIGENCRVGAGSVIRDSQIGDGVNIGEYCFVGTSVVEAGCQIGPFSRLRQDNHVEAGAHIGNFVELKKTRFGKGSKAMHLAYLGDAVIGAGVNVGAGTITCNYDGVNKHVTQIGEGVFVGSNSTLVAPVELEAGSYIAAGSVITKPVPSGALGVGRGRQANIEGWVERKKKAE